MAGEIRVNHTGRKKCEHGPEDGCMWCCHECNLARHLCPGCGAGLNHGEAVCSDCEERYK